MRQLSAQELYAMLASANAGGPLLIDVREDWEFAICQIEGSRNVPMHEVPATLQQLDPSALTVIICHHGIRSAQIADYLERSGFSDVHNLAGGVDAWAREIDGSMPTY